MELSKIYKAKTYEEAEKQCPKGYRMIYLWELIKLVEEGKEIFNYEKGFYRYFLCKQNKQDKKAKIVRRLDRDSDGSWYASWSDVLDSDDYYRVVYVREK